MAQSLTLKIKGRFTSFNELSEVPDGALLEAENIAIDQNSVAEPRRGFGKESGTFSDPTYRADTITEFETKKLSNNGVLGSPTKLSYLNSGTWTDLETVSPIASRKMKFVGANQNLYCTSSTGIRALESYNGTPRASGAYKGLDLTASTSASASTWLATTYSVAYRAVWLYKDSHNNLVFGAPSQREVYTNSSGSTKAVDIQITIPNGVTTSWFLQVYRSESVVGTPNDEMGLVYEINPTAGEITAKSMTFTDIVPTELRGATLYTSASQDGLALQNEIAPLAEDMDTFRECVFLANTTSKHRFNLTLISVGGTAGVANDDTITIGGVVYTGKAAETIASGYFKISTGGSASQNIADTAKSLVRIINQYSSSTVYAYYVSGETDLPGMILLEERSLGGSAFVVITSRATCWSPTDIPSSGTTKTSSNDRFVNGLFWSKPNQPECFPLTNFVQVGSKNDEILRIRALKDALYVLKDSGKVYKVTGDYPDFQVDKIEDSVKLIGRETVQVLNNQIYLLSDQGVVVLGDSTKVISRPIEQELLSVINQNYDLVKSIAFGVGYESDRKYILYMPAGSGDTYPTMSHSYNIFTNAWTKNTYSATCGFVDKSNNFYIGNPIDRNVFVERKTYSSLDYADYHSTTTITSINGTTVTIDAGIDALSSGDILYQSSSLFAVISSVDQASQTITIEVDPGLTTASVDLLKAIDTRIVWVPAVMGNAGLQKQYHRVDLMFKRDFTGTGTIGFTSDIDLTESLTSITGRDIGLWGLSAWGEFSWGGDSFKRPVTQWVPRSKQRASQLTLSWNHRRGFSNWQLEGVSLFGEIGSEEVGRS